MELEHQLLEIVHNKNSDAKSEEKHKKDDSKKSDVPEEDDFLELSS